jgi:hypothetical protein
LELQGKKTILELVDRLATDNTIKTSTSMAELVDRGISIPEIPPLTACYFEIKVASRGNANAVGQL